jgi:hypothetical protein
MVVLVMRTDSSLLLLVTIIVAVSERSKITVKASGTIISVDYNYANTNKGQISERWTRIHSKQVPTLNVATVSGVGILYMYRQYLVKVAG